MTIAKDISELLDRLSAEAVAKGMGEITPDERHFFVSGVLHGLTIAHPMGKDDIAAAAVTLMASDAITRH